MTCVQYKNECDFRSKVVNARMTCVQYKNECDFRSKVVNACMTCVQYKNECDFRSKVVNACTIPRVKKNMQGAFIILILKYTCESADFFNLDFDQKSCTVI